LPPRQPSDQIIVPSYLQSPCRLYKLKITDHYSPDCIDFDVESCFITGIFFQNDGAAFYLNGGNSAAFSDTILIDCVSVYSAGAIYANNFFSVSFSYDGLCECLGGNDCHSISIKFPDSIVGDLSIEYCHLTDVDNLIGRADVISVSNSEAYFQFTNISYLNEIHCHVSFSNLTFENNSFKCNTICNTTSSFAIYFSSNSLYDESILTSNWNFLFNSNLNDHFHYLIFSLRSKAIFYKSIFISNYFQEITSNSGLVVFDSCYYCSNSFSVASSEYSCTKPYRYSLVETAQFYFLVSPSNRYTNTFNKRK
jgi:hypothetical protein